MEKIDSKRQRKIELLQRLQDSEKWPEIFRPKFMAELNEFADEAFQKKTVEGFISSLLIYQQITENMVRSLIEISQFYLKCTLHSFSFKELNFERKMFGELLSELERCPEISGTELFIQKCRDLNEIRINIVHKISQKKSIGEITDICKMSKEIFDQIFSMYDDIYDQWRVSLNCLKKDYSDFDIEELID